MLDRGCIVDRMDERSTIPVIDAHQHFWDLQRNRHPWLQDEPPIPFRYGDYAAIRHTYLPDDYRRDAAAANVVATVHVEAEWAQDDPVGEQRWLSGLRRTARLPTVSVAQARLDRADVAEVLAAQASFDFVRGIRHKPRAAADPRDARRGESGSMDDPRWRAGFAMLAGHGLSFDLQTPFWHAEAAAALARDFPSTQIIVNHGFLPCDRSPDGLASWRRALDLVAGQPNVALKISGLGLPGRSWPAEDNMPVIRDAIRIFGADRCMFASNYPVDSLCGRFDAILAGFRAAIADRPEAEQVMLLGGNAARLYRIAL
jgi:predicted TIM-barrel fold metal-dependent hydrolase